MEGTLYNNNLPVSWSCQIIYAENFWKCSYWKCASYGKKLLDDRQKLFFFFQGIQPDDIPEIVLHLHLVMCNISEPGA